MHVSSQIKNQDVKHLQTYYEGKGKGFVTRSIPQRGISLPVQASPSQGIPHPLPSPLNKHYKSHVSRF